MQVSVVMCSYNRANYIGEALTALYNQHVSYEHYEVYENKDVILFHHALSPTKSVRTLRTSFQPRHKDARVS